MATVGSIRVAFEADVSELEGGLDTITNLFTDIEKSLKDFNSSLEDVGDALDTLADRIQSVSSDTDPIQIRTDTSEVEQAVAEVQDLSDEIERTAPTVQVRVAGDIGAEFLNTARRQIEGYGESLVALGRSAGGAIKSAASAANAVGSVLDGTSSSLDGIIVAVGRAQDAFGQWRSVLEAAAASTAVFLTYSGGMRTVLGAVTGSVGATARVMASLGAAATAAAVSIATYSAIVAVARVATSGLSEEARGYVAGWVSLGATVVAGTAALAAAGVTFSSLYKRMQESSSIVDFFARAFGDASGAVTSFATNATKYLMGVVNFMTLARVASGEFRTALGRLGEQAESIANMADRFGATTEQMLILEYAARSASVGMSQLARASQAFFTSVSKVRIGQLGTVEAQEAKFAFDKLGISISDLRDRSPQQVFALVADRLTGVSDAADRASIAFDLFGRQAANVLPALKGLKEAEADSRRLGTTLSGMRFSMFEDVDTSFDRATEAAANFSESMLVSFAPIQTAAANAFADIVGGATAAFAPLRNLAADAAVPFQQFIEILARLTNIILRVVGAAAQLATAFFDASALAGPWKVLGDAIKEALGYIEGGVSVVEDIARAFFSELNPALEETASWIEKVQYILQQFLIVIAAGGAAGAFAEFFNITILQRFWSFLTGLRWDTIRQLAVRAFGAVGTAARKLLIDSVANAQAWVQGWLVAGLRMIQGFVTPFISQVAVIITGNAAMATSSIVTGIAMATAFVVATAGLALVGIAILAVVNNFSKLYDYFANFSDNAAKLFTLEGLAEAGTAVANAIFEAFKQVVDAIGGFFGRLIRNIIVSVAGIKMPEKITAATATAGSVIESRRGRQMAQFQGMQAAGARFGFADTKLKPPTDDYAALEKALGGARGQMTGLSFEAAKFGEQGRKAFLAAKADFDKLQQSLADDTLKGKEIIDENGVKRTETTLEAFQRRSAEIQKALRENLNLADVISPEQFQQSAEKVQEAIEDAYAQARELSRGEDLGSTLSVDRFFPSSDAIKEQSAQFAREYENELKSIEASLQAGDFGTGQEALKMASRMRDQAKNKFDRNTGKIKADVSFASEIRKALEDAFLTPAAKFEKKLKEIADNKSLTDIEKQAARRMEGVQAFESEFGKSVSKSLSERRGLLESTGAAGEISDVRMEAERRKLDIERRTALGLEATPGQSLQAGVDKINDVFGIGENGKTVADLNPKELKEYEEAIKKNKEAVKASIGVEQTASQKFAEARAKLQQAFEDNVISEKERDKAIKEQKDSLLSALGISKSPTQEFEDAVSKIRENASELSPEELSKGLKEAKDKLLSALGIDKSPAEAMQESMKKLDEAYKKGAISFDEFAKGSQKARDTLLQSLGIPLDPVKQLAERMNDLQQAFDADQITGEEFKRGQEEARRAMLPGSADESPVAIFKRQMEELDRARQSGLIGDEELADRRLAVQADLQESLRPALDKLAPDRRQVGAADARSKAGVDTFFRILQGRDNPSLKAQLEIARNTKVLAEAARDPEVQPIIAQLGAR